MEKSCRKFEPKASSRLLLNFQNSHCMQEILLRIRYFEKGLSKSLSKKLTLFFLLNPVLFNEQSYQKEKGSGTSDQSPYRL